MPSQKERPIMCGLATGGQKKPWKIAVDADPGQNPRDVARGIGLGGDVARNAVGHTREQQIEIGVGLLHRAFALLRSEGWRKPSADPRDAEDGPGLSVSEALSESSDGEHLGIDVHYAIHLLSRIQWPVWRWEAKPLVAERDVIGLFQAAIGAVGGDVPAASHLGPCRRGGWTVTHGRLDAPRQLAAYLARGPAHSREEQFRRVVAYVADAESARLLPTADMVVRATSGAWPGPARLAGLIDRTARGRYCLTAEGRRMALEMERERKDGAR